MNKGLKIIGVIMSLLLLSVFLAIALINAPYIMPEQLERFRFFTLTNYYMQQYIFWAAVVFAVLAIIILLVVLFYPKSRGTFVMKREDGKLTIDKKRSKGWYVPIYTKKSSFIHLKYGYVQRKIESISMSTETWNELLH